MHSCKERKKMMMIWSLCLIFSLSNSKLVFASPASRHLCRPDQKDALWEFKSEFYVQQDRSSPITGDPKTEKWRNDTDCCSWDGVSCDPKTGKVIELDISKCNLNGPLRFNSSLFRLDHLQSLVLDNNNISSILPDSIGNLEYLRFLSIGGIGTKLFGKIPSSIGNLSHLTDLYLSGDFTGELPDTFGKLNRLKHLILATKFTGNFPHVLLNLSEITQIQLISNCQGMLPSNMSSLSKLEDFYISGNSFSGSLPSSLFTLPSLVQLDLSRNYFSGSLEIGNISSLSQLGCLSAGENNFIGPIPVSISKLVNLWFLDLSFWNTARAMVDFSILLHLKSLRALNLPYLNTRSTVDMSVFSHLKSLDWLDLSGNILKISSTPHLPHLDTLILSSCNISEFPKFLQNQTGLIYLDISANQIKGHVPEWLWTLPHLRYLNISQNSFIGFEGSADIIQTSAKTMLDISSNLFHHLPLLPTSMMFFSASDNRFSGEIPRGICELLTLDTLVLSNNNFSGSIPRCFNTFNTTLSILHLQNNSLSGVFWEESVSDHLRWLDLGNNQFSGELPDSLINCTRLEFLNVENNRFRDKFPSWLRLLPNLQILVLRSNEFYGPIYSPGDSLMSFPKLRIFDISNNGFTGVLPSAYFSGWNAMSSVVDFVDNTPIRYAGFGSGYYHKSVGLTNKGLRTELVGSVLMMYITIDLSGNRFEGDIPESIRLLKELIALNMSNNAFTGHIPPSLVNLTNLQSLDLSQNRFSGKIPPELGKLTFLAKMNFSHNMLEGPIPQGTQIQSQDSSSFAGNPWLCGAPLQETCGGGGGGEEKGEEKEEEDQVLSWNAAAIGYVPGVFCGFTIGHILISYKHDWFMRIFHSFA